MASPRWSGLKTPNHDLCLDRPDGCWDMVYGSEGWVLYSPVYLTEASTQVGNRFRTVLGTTDRDVALLRANLFLQKHPCHARRFRE